MAGQSLAALLAELRRMGIRDERVLAALASVPREDFVDPADRDRAYDNVALGIAAGQTISQPYVVALMTQALALAPTDRVLEVGAGSGYQAAVLGRLTAAVISIERHAPLAESARQRLAALGIANVTIQIGDGSLGWPASAPYDAIIVTAAAPALPVPLLQQLTPAHGRLVIPVGGSDDQSLLLVRRDGDRHTTTDLGPVRFVPLIGAAAWGGPAREQPNGAHPPAAPWWR
jgi:protein-L-isoaspartate(D-aspartate) O-methyltransferase